MKNIIRNIKKSIKQNEELFEIYTFFYGFILRIDQWYFSSKDESEYHETLKRWYKRKTGRHLNLENPETLMEKIQWLKLYDKLPLKTTLADKYRAKEWVAEKIGAEYVIPLLGVWKNADEIDFDQLPDQFVIKTTHSSDNKCNIIVKDKYKLNKRRVRRRLKFWLSMNFGFLGIGTGPYAFYNNDIPPLIIAEKYISMLSNAPIDYKFYCFNGEPKFFEVVSGFFTSINRTFFDMNWQPLPFTMGDIPKITPTPQKSENYEKMVHIAKTLSEGFKLVRVDLYNIDGKIFFGELTFDPGDVKLFFQPCEYNKIIGDMVKL